MYIVCYNDDMNFELVAEQFKKWKLKDKQIMCLHGS